MTTDPTVAAVLPVRNGADRVERAIAAVLDQTHPVHELLIAVGLSDDDPHWLATAAAARDQRISVVANPTGRTPNGLNLAIAASTADVIVRVDAGSVLPTDYVARALTTLASTGAANVGAIQHSVGSTPFERAVAAAVTSKFGVGNATYRYGDGSFRPVDPAYLGVFRRSALKAVGGYDDHFTRNQDYELNWRLRHIDNGVWLDPVLRVVYRPRSSLRSLARQYWEHGWWRAETVRKHPTSLKPRQLAAPLLLLGLSLSGFAALRGRRRGALAVPSIYAGAVAFTAAAANPEISLAERKRMLLIFPTLHLSWACGLISSAFRIAPFAIVKALRRVANDDDQMGATD